MDMDKIEGQPIGGLEPGDVLVLRPAEPLTREMAEGLAVHVSGLLPDIKVLVVQPGLMVTPMRFVAGDVCVVRTDPLPAEAIARLKVHVAAALPADVSVLVTEALIEKAIDKPGWTERLAHIERRTPVERQAAELVATIEGMGGHPLLTDAQTLVHDAMCILGRWHDMGAPGGRPAVPLVAPLTYHVTEDGEPWALYREGHADPASFTRQAVIDAMNQYGSGDGDDWAADNPELPPIGVFHITSIRPEPTTPTKRRRRDDDDDMPLDDAGLWFCDPDDPGAYPVTGFKFG